MKHQNKIINKERTVDCLYCKGEIYVRRNLKIGSYIKCISCDSRFEIVNLSPVMIDYPYFNDDYIKDEDLFYDFGYGI